MKKPYLILFLIGLVSFISCEEPKKDVSIDQIRESLEQDYEKQMTAARDSIIRVMREQEAAWNRGDMPGFMAGYAKNDSTLFVGKTRVNYGWQTVLDNYIKAFPDKSAMGKLQFDLLRVVPLDEDHAYVVGKWSLTENEKPSSGHFVLIFEHNEQGWRIIVDGTS